MTGGSNTAIGDIAAFQTTGSGNTAIGAAALDFNTTGSNNTALGTGAGHNSVTGSNNTFIGWLAGSGQSSDLTNATAIGENAQVACSNCMALGGSGGDAVSVGIGTSTPDNTLTVVGTADKTGGGSWGSFSDARLKTVFGAFHPGLKQVLKLHPIVYRYKEQNALGIKDTEEHVGFVAQDVEKVIPEAVTKDAEGFRIVNNDPILWTMLNAIKDQQREIAALKARLAQLETAQHSAPAK
jgi:hypothetical protein